MSDYSGKRCAECACMPDSRGLGRDFHDVAIVDMGDLTESSVSMDKLSLIRRQ